MVSDAAVAVADIKAVIDDVYTAAAAASRTAREFESPRINAAAPTTTTPPTAEAAPPNGSSHEESPHPTQLGVTSQSHSDTHNNSTPLTQKLERLFRAITAAAVAVLLWKLIERTGLPFAMTVAHWFGINYLFYGLLCVLYHKGRDFYLAVRDIVRGEI